jgi:arginase family enzyme
MDPIDELATLLRPAGGGVYLVSTGKDEQEALQARLYGAASPAEIDARWRVALAGIARARAIILGVPSDVGAGFRRGANLGPGALRAGLLAADPGWPQRAAAWGVVDIGDVFVVPQLLHDDMLSPAQRLRTARALYPAVSDDERARLPVSPLSIQARALELVFRLNPRVVPIVLGGDHSVAWPVALALASARKDERWGIVHPDAHTDLMSERLGITYCFATWAHHANQLLGADGRMVQLGIRATRFDRASWERGSGVRQFWADECRARPEAVIDETIAHLRAKGVTGVYLSNDIDATDSRWADATGTPEPDGLTPAFMISLIRRLGRELPLVAADLVEVAPPLGAAGGPTVPLGVRYLRETIAAALHEPPPDEPVPG